MFTLSITITDRMKEKHSGLQIRIDTIDGSTRVFVHNDPELAQRTLAGLHPATIFARERITITDEDSEITLAPPLITRIDLATSELSVWDFPFVLGALLEVTEAEFSEGIQNLKDGEALRSPGGIPVFLDLEMVNGQRVFLWMQIVAGLPAARLERIYSLFKERRLIFGLRTGGIGILNLANLVRFVVHPEPARTAPRASARDARPLRDRDRIEMHYKQQHPGSTAIYLTQRKHTTIDLDEPE